MTINKKVCRVITLGFHWWKHYPGEKRYIRCRLCGQMPDSMWNTLNKFIKKGRKMKKKILGVIVLLLVFGFCLSGCEEALGLRLSPTEAQKQSSELTYALALKVDKEGTDPESPASKKLVSGTAASLSYTGRPKEVPNPDDFETITSIAADDAEKRPDLGKSMDSALEIGLAIAGLFGGVGGVKVSQVLIKAHQKAKAFNEVVVNNDLFKKLADSDTTRDVITLFKDANVSQTPTTQKLVAEARAENKIRIAGFSGGNS